jgi:Protein of unknown function (DUF2812)
MSATMRAFWFIPFRHVAADDLERWFEARAERGWAPRHLGQFSSLRMRLAPCAPKTCRYVVDLQVKPRQDYFTTFRDSGWEHVGQMASMHVWRKDYDGARPEAFTDSHSRTLRARRIALAAATAAGVFLATTLVLAAAALAADTDRGTQLQLWIAAGFGAALTAAIGAAVTVIWRARQR